MGVSMHWMRRLAAGTAVLGLMVMSVLPASAAVPRPRSDEWWVAPWALPDVWKTTTGSGVTVAVIDSGVNAKVPELAGSVLRGTDVTGAGTDGRTDFDAKEDGHGTSMAALIAAHGGGSSGFVGVAPGAKILPIRMTDSKRHFDYDAAMGSGIRYAADHGAKVVNISLGTDGPSDDYCPAPLAQAIEYAVARDVIIVVAAGDSGAKDNPPMYPASCPGVVVVGAIDRYAQPWKGTERQPYVTLAAPGVHVGWVARSGRYYPNGWGSSQAAALTSGAVALVRAANPGMPAREVVQRLIATAKDVGPPGPDYTTGYGVSRIFHAMSPSTYPVPADAPNPVYDGLGGSQTPPATTPSTPSTPPAGAVRHSGGGSSAAGVVAFVVTLIALALAGVVAVRRSKRRAEPEAPTTWRPPESRPPAQGLRPAEHRNGPSGMDPPSPGARPIFLRHDERGDGGTDG